MPKKTAEKVYENLSRIGLYEEANLDLDIISKSKTIAIEDYNYGKTLRNMEDKNYRIIFNINYDSLRELCDQLMRFKKQKISNHQGLFAFVILNFKELKLDWSFLENVRKIRNENKYEGKDITKEMWKEIEPEIDNYIIKINKHIEKEIKNVKD